MNRLDVRLERLANVLKQQVSAVGLAGVRGHNPLLFDQPKCIDAPTATVKDHNLGDAGHALLLDGAVEVELGDLGVGCGMRCGGVGRD